MVMCDYCKEFFHPKCVGISKNDSVILDKYKCHSCIDLDKMWTPTYEEGIVNKVKLMIHVLLEKTDERLKVLGVLDTVNNEL